jgi:hypothetical protein
MLAFALVATGMAAVSAEVDNVYDVFWSRDDVKMVPWYNHDNTVMKGPEYQAEVLKLLAAGYIPLKGYAISEYSGGAGQQYGSYDEDYFVKTKLSVQMTDDQETWLWGILGIRSTAEGIQYYDGSSWVSVPPEMELEIQVEELQLQGVFDHDAKAFVWFDVGGAEITDTPTINPEGTEAQWIFDDYWINGINLIHAQIIVDGEEEWDTRTIIYELPQAGAGSPQLLPKNYGLVLNQPYNKYGISSIAEIPEEFSKYYKIDGDKIITYTNSPLDVWFFKNVWKVNHDAYLEDLEEERNNKWLAARVK